LLGEHNANNCIVICGIDDMFMGEKMNILHQIGSGKFQTSHKFVVVSAVLQLIHYFPVASERYGSGVFCNMPKFTARS
jgi:hypothetical protein